MSGVSSGLGSVLDSTVSGVKGVVQKPAEGFRQDGASGLALGALKGIAGLVVKPVSGVMDAVSKASQGIEVASTNEKTG